VPGTYTIVVASGNTATGSVLISLTTNTTNPTIPANVPVTSATVINGSLLAYNFIGNAGQTVNVSVNYGWAQWFSVYVLGPTGVTLAQSPELFGGTYVGSGLTLPAQGIYTILFAAGNNGTATTTLTTQAAALSFVPAAGAYASAQTVSFLTTPAGASVNYTTDGSTPSETAGTLYTGPIAVGTTRTFKAIAFQSGWVDSPVVTATYTIGAVTVSGQISAGTTPLAGVTVNLTGAQTSSAVSDSNGDYSFTVATPGTYAVAPTAASHSFCPSSVSIVNPAVSQTVNFASGGPSREYIRLGGRVIAISNCGQ